MIGSCNGSSSDLLRFMGDNLNISFLLFQPNSSDLVLIEVILVHDFFIPGLVCMSCIHSCRPGKCPVSLMFLEDVFITENSGGFVIENSTVQCPDY